MSQISFEDFYQVPNLKFDVLRLRQDLETILKKKNFETPGVTHFGAIPLNQIPNDENSIKGNNIRGKYWTIADETGNEKQEIHSILKYKFLLKEEMIDGELHQGLKSTTTLTKEEFGKLTQEVFYWANDTLNINLPNE